MTTTTINNNHNSNEAYHIIILYSITLFYARDLNGIYTGMHVTVIADFDAILHFPSLGFYEFQKFKYSVISTNHVGIPVLPATFHNLQ